MRALDFGTMSPWLAFSAMRFRKRPPAPPESGADDTVWSRPDSAGEAEDPAEGGPDESGYEPAGEPVEAMEDEAVYAPPDEPEYAPPEDAPYAPPEEPAYARPEAPAYAPPEEPEYAPPEEPAAELIEEPPAEAIPEPAPVTRWRGGGRGDPVRGSDGSVRAAGGVVWSRWRGGLRVVVVHRPRYDDWSLPKGKAGPGESDAECALREVREETGLACSLGEELGTTTYYDRHGRLKNVRYYAMQPLGGGETPQAEVDEVRWLGLDDARQIMTYARDVDILDLLVAMASSREDVGEPPVL